VWALIITGYLGLTKGSLWFGTLWLCTLQDRNTGASWINLHDCTLLSYLHRTMSNAKCWFRSFHDSTTCIEPRSALFREIANIVSTKNTFFDQYLHDIWKNTESQFASQRACFRLSERSSNCILNNLEKVNTQSITYVCNEYISFLTRYLFSHYK